MTGPLRQNPPCRLALALAGGGARGAYQVGCWRAWREAGLTFDAFAGTSVGALNAALMALDREDDAVRVWKTIARADVYEVDAARVRTFLRGLIADLALLLVARRLPRVSRLVRAGRLLLHAIPGGRLATRVHSLLCEGGMLSTAPLARLLDGLFDYEALVRSPRPVYVSVSRQGGPLAWLQPKVEFRRLQDLAAGEVRKFLLASAAVPLLFPSIVDGAERLYDGGLAAPGRMPLHPLAALSPERILAVHLKPGRVSEPGAVPGSIVHDVAPARPLGGIGGQFRLSRAPEFLEQGYADGRAALERWALPRAS